MESKQRHGSETQCEHARGLGDRCRLEGVCVVADTTKSQVGNENAKSERSDHSDRGGERCD